MTQSLKIEQRAIDALIPYVRNARTHSDEQVAQLAASIKEFGWTNPILVDGENGIIAGHGRLQAARKMGLSEVPVIELADLTDAQRRAYILADNRLALNAGWDFDMLAVELDELRDADFDLELLGFDQQELNDLIGTDKLGPKPGDGKEDETPEVPEDPVSIQGDIWILGGHRVMCGDSIIPADVALLMNGQKATLIHADPPYGMGKEGDGVANDNLYAEKLDAFQMAWWRAFRQFTEDNGSAYVWGNSPDLWRLWYRGGLCDSEKFELRNEIVWDKKNIAGMASPGLTQYPEASERCLFFQFGNQFLGNINIEDFPETWEPVRAYMEGEAKAAEIKSDDIKRVCGCSMYDHWFTRSQFTLMPEKHYKSLQVAYPGNFAKPWKELKKEWDRVKGGPTSEIQGARSYFDNAHDAMRDVWDFPRVIGEERHGHATPKPVAMMERVMMSSLPDGGLCAEPFGGSGSTLMGAEITGRRCYSMELKPNYVDVIVKRWQNYTGEKATLEADGRTFEEIEAERLN